MCISLLEGACLECLALKSSFCRHTGPTAHTRTQTGTQTHTHLVATQVRSHPRDLDGGVGFQVLVELLDVARFL